MKPGESGSRELAMADEARSRLGRGLTESDRRCRGGRASRRPRAAQGADRIPQANPRNPRRTFSMPNSANSPTRSNCGVISRSWCGRQACGSLQSSASGAGAPLQSPACMKCQSCRSTSATAMRSDRDHRERSARRPQHDGRGAGLSRALSEQFKRSQEEIAKIVGKAAAMSPT